MDRFSTTLAAIVTPRRLLPILAVVAALVGVQVHYSAPLTAIVPIGMSAAFIVTGPAAWRVLLAQRRLAWPLAAGLYAMVAAIVVALFGIVIPHALDLGPTFLTDAGSLVVAVVLFLVGGWGLGRDIELELDLGHAQLKAIRTHLDPHFLFNTLNAIAEWCAEDPRVAEDATLRLAALLRDILDGIEQRTWPLARELSVVRDFLELHRIRDPFTYSLPDEASDASVPPLVVLSLVENAVKHGPRKGNAGAIVLRITYAPLRVEIENPGRFAPTDAGRGLDLVRKRLALSYGNRAQLDIRAIDGDRTLAQLTVAT